jgi:hypothetical protein
MICGKPGRKWLELRLEYLGLPLAVSGQLAMGYGILFATSLILFLLSCVLFTGSDLKGAFRNSLALAEKDTVFLREFIMLNRRVA